MFKNAPLPPKIINFNHCWLKKPFSFLLLLYFLFFCTTHGFTQQAPIKQYNVQKTYLDALELSKIYALSYDKTKQVTDSLLNQHDSILGRYFADISNKTFSSTSRIGKERTQLDNSIPRYATRDNRTIEKREPSVSHTAIFTSPLSGVNLSESIIHGASSFMVSRAKSELANMGLSAIFNTLTDTITAKIFTALFPHTLQQIKRLKEENNYYTADILFLQELVVLDMQHISNNALQLAFDQYLSQGKNVEHDLLYVGYLVVKYSRQGWDISGLMRLMSEEKKLYSPQVKEVLALMYLSSEALRDSSQSKTTWIQPSRLLDVNTQNPTDKIVAQIFYELFTAQIQETTFGNRLKAESTEEQEDLLPGMLSFVNILNNAYQFSKNKDFNLTTTEDLLHYINNIATAFYEIFNSELIQLTYGDLSSESANFVLKYSEIIRPFLAKDYLQGIAIIVSTLPSLIDTNNVNKIMKAFTFLTQLATMKDGEDFEKLLNAYALPMGSASIKRGSSCNVSVNGYVGLTGGLETLYKANGHPTTWKGNAGLTAPIGITFTICGWWSLFLSIIDLATMVNLRFDGDNTSYANLKLEHFLSPGIGMYYNFPKSPLTLGFHYNYIPHLRTITFENATANITEQRNANITRANVSLLIDIPFFTVANKEKSKRK